MFRALKKNTHTNIHPTSMSSSFFASKMSPPSSLYGSVFMLLFFFSANAILGRNVCQTPNALVSARLAIRCSTFSLFFTDYTAGKSIVREKMIIILGQDCLFPLSQSV